MKRIVIFCCFVWFVRPLSATDPLESLIDSETTPDLADDNTELPPIFLFGDKNAVRIYSPGTRTLDETWICRSLELDELIEVTRGDVNAPETDLNFSLPRVRKIFEDACLIRKDDYLIAHTPGFQIPVTVKRFFIRREPTLCSKESPFTLWAAFEEILEQPPLLFSTTLDVPEGENRFKNLNEIEDVRLDEKSLKNLKSKVPFVEDFDIWGKPLDDERIKMLIYARRKSVAADDNGLPNEMLLVDRSGGMEEIWVERVDLRYGSGHIRPQAVWDYNGDGFLDLWIEGDHRTCPYRVLLTGREDGFETGNLPNEPCDCQ